jgi:tetratricopeptide (TPR) repeat protein
MPTMDRVISIPGNQHALERLRGLLAAEQPIAFVGAGASVGLYPLWGGLLAQLADEAVSRGLASDADRVAWLRIAALNPQQAVRGIKERLGRQTFGAVLRRIFGYQNGDDGNPFTFTHRVLLELGFRGYVTTNYDPGLLEARRVVRPEVAATGYATWQDGDLLRRWLTGEVFEEHSCPILYAHGVFERSDTVVLGAGEYREAYRAGLFRQLVDKLWSQERLVFIGFGFTDAWFGVVAEQVLDLTAHQAAGEPRHIAIVGLPDGQDYSPELRGLFRDAYDAEVLLYPMAVSERRGVRHEDHSLLGAILTELRGSALESSATAWQSAPDQSAAPELHGPQLWVHDTTEDDRYTEPGEALSRLDRWAADPRVRAVAVTGIGGLGKTALIGYWLKQRHGAATRPARGLLGWSFGVDRQVERFFAALVGFVAKRLRVAIPNNTRPVDAAIAALRAVPLVVILDGLEILQEAPGDLLPEGPGSLTYGEFLEDDLRAFLDAACRLDHSGLVVLTSRFPFADLTGYLGTGLRLLELDRLSLGEGAEVLARLDVQGSDEDRRTVSRRLEGHPLALRIFASTLARYAHGDPSRLLEIAFAKEGLRDDDPLEVKLRQLLEFYETQLPPAWRALLGVVALFPDRVDLDTALSLARQLPGIQEQLRGVADSQLRAALAALAADGLLSGEHDPPSQDGRHGYSCHPVVRDHFRAALLGRGQRVAVHAAGLLTGKASGQVRSRAELAVVTNAIGLLLDTGQVDQADALYQVRLASGGVFLSLPAPREGLQCGLKFVADERRRDQVREQRSESALAFYLTWTSLCARMTAEFELAEFFIRKAVDLDRRLNDEVDLSTTLQNYVGLLVNLGRLTEAEAIAREALEIASQSDDAWTKCGSSATLAFVLSLQGQIAGAITGFETAKHLQRPLLGSKELYALHGTWWAEFRFRLGYAAEARTLTMANLSICERRGWHEDVARCRWLVGRLDAVDGAYDAAASELARAAATCRAGHLLPDLVQVLLAQADLARRQQAWDAALSYVEEAITAAASRRMPLPHADALVLRGRLYLERGRAEALADDHRLEAEQALDDADTARTLAQRCHYLWAERDAAVLRADAYGALGDTDRAHRARREAEFLSHRLRLAT